MDPLKPAPTLLIKIGSIAVHADEFLHPSGHAFDAIAIRQLLKDPEVVAWIKAMDAMAFLPKKRS